MTVAVEFPNNIVDTMKEALAFLSPNLPVRSRQLRPTDPNGTLSIYPQEWGGREPVMGGQYDPSLSIYTFMIESLIKDMDEERGRKNDAGLAKTIRLMLYRDPTLRVSLTSLSELEEGFTEKVQRYGIRRQRFRSNQIRGEFTYLTSTEFWVESEVV